jgi:hypothetical protein
MRRLQIILFLLFFSVFSKAEILTETFDWFSPDTLSGGSFWTNDSFLLEHWGYDLAAADNLRDFISAINLTAVGTSTEATGSILSLAGDHLTLNGTTDYWQAGDQYDPGTNDFTVQVWFKTPANVAPGKYLVAKRRAGPDIGWQIDIFSSTVRSIILNTSSAAATLAISANTEYYLWARYDRSDDLIVALYSSTGVVYDTVDISGFSAANLNVPQNYTIGAYPVTPSTGEWDGGVMGVKQSTSFQTDQQLVDDAFLAEGWKSGGGNVYRNGFVGKSHSQGFSNTAGTVLTVGLKGGTQQAMTTITGDSTRYTIQIPGITSLSSDSLIFKGSGDSVWVALTDSTFTSGYGLQIVVDVWQLTRLSAPVDTFAYIDNITVSTYLIPVTATVLEKRNLSKYNNYQKLGEL